jgi:hypothetical protein
MTNWKELNNLMKQLNKLDEATRKEPMYHTVVSVEPGYLAVHPKMDDGEVLFGEPVGFVRRTEEVTQTWYVQDGRVTMFVGLPLFTDELEADEEGLRWVFNSLDDVMCFMQGVVGIDW